VPYVVEARQRLLDLAALATDDELDLDELADSCPPAVA